MASIGTPFSSTAKKVLMCGSGELGKEVVIELQRYGVEVIAVDRYEKCSGHAGSSPLLHYFNAGWRRSTQNYRNREARFDRS